MSGELEYGPELVTNGTFDVDLSGWTIGTNWIWEDGQARSNYNTSILRQLISTEINKVYMLTAYTSLSQSLWIHQTSNHNIDSDNGRLFGATFAKNGDRYLVWLSTSSTYYLTCRSITNNIVYWDNISVKEIIFPSVSSLRPRISSPDLIGGLG